jgi:plastocyanin
MAMKIRTYRAILGVAFVLALGAMFVACSDDDDSTGPDDDFTGTIRVLDSVFSPANVTISVGDSVTWRFDGALNHTVTHGTSATVPPDANKLFDSPTQSSGTFGYRFNDAGSYAYFCRIHLGMGMKGTVTVQP